MAGGANTLLIPDLVRFRPDWIDSSEVSFSLDGMRITGLSFFFHDEASCAEFASREGLDSSILPRERALRAKYGILPRYWLKLHLAGPKTRGVSQYFHIDPGLHYPITTIRRFLRDQGFSDVGEIEEILKPALEDRGTQWGLAIKDLPGRIIPRIFYRIARPLLPQSLGPFIRFGYLSDAVAHLYLDWDRRISADEQVFISMDPTLRRFSSLDFCNPPSEQFPSVCHPGLPGKFDYLKVRIPDPSRTPELTAYLPLRRIMPSFARSENLSS